MKPGDAVREHPPRSFGPLADTSDGYPGASEFKTRNPGDEQVLPCPDPSNSFQYENHNVSDGVRSRTTPAFKQPKIIMNNNASQPLSVSGQSSFLMHDSILPAPVITRYPLPGDGMRRVLRTAIATILMAAGTLPSGAQTMFFDFGSAANATIRGAAGGDPVNYWNNVTDTIGMNPIGMLTNIVTADNSPTSIGLAIVSRFNGANENGTQASTLFATNATRDSLYGNTEIWNSLTNIFPSFKLTGLNIATVYNFTIYASRTGVGDNREAGYGIVGASSNYVTFNPANNVNGFTNVDGLVPDANGEITISMSPTANNNNAYHFTYLGVLKVDAIPPQLPITFTVEPTNSRVVAFEPVTFRAAVQGTPPYFIQWLSNNVVIPNANQFTYTIPAVTVDMNGSQFRVSVSNLTYSALSSNATLRVITDTNPPVLLSVSTLDGLSIQLYFDELLDPGYANDFFSYTVNNGAATVSVATLQPDGKSVVLTLQSKISGTFQVTVNYLQDLSGNVIAPNTTLSGEVPQPEFQSLLFDFGGPSTTDHGPSPDDPTNYWNNVGTAVGGSDTGQLPNVVTIANLPTTVGLQMIRRFNGFNDVGTQSSTLFPSDATRDSLYGNTESFNGLIDIFPSFKLTGLNTALVYNITFYASRTGVSDNRETGYTVEGAGTAFATFNPANNINGFTNVLGVVPTAAGDITISLEPTANNNNGNHFTYLGVLRVDPSKPAAHFLPLNITGGQVVVQWTGPGYLEWAPTVVGPWTRFAPQPASPYSESFAPGENRFYRLNPNP